MRPWPMRRVECLAVTYCRGALCVQRPQLSSAYQVPCAYPARWTRGPDIKSS